MAKRIRELDIVRGITILLVVSSHVGMPDQLNAILSTFRMPLFFIVSGYLFSASKYTNGLPLLKNRVNGLLIPYASSCVLFYAIWLGRNQLEGRVYEFDWFIPIIGMFYGNGEDLIINIPLWFLVCLFCVHIVFYFSYKLIKHFSMIIQYLFYFALGAIGFVIGQHIFLPWGLDVAFVMQPLFFLGNQMKQHQILNKVNIPIVVILLAGIAYSMAFIQNGYVSASDRIFKNLVFFYIGGLGGSVLVFMLTTYLKKLQSVTTVFSLIGRDSLAILVFHLGGYVVLMKFHALMKLPVTGYDWIGYTIGSVIISMIIARVLRKVSLLHYLFLGQGGLKEDRTKEQVPLSS